MSERGEAAARERDVPEVPPEGDQPPPKVIRELLEAFDDETAGGSRSLTRPMSDTELGERAAAGAEAAPGLQPEVTKRSTRRSRRESKREAKREAKRLAGLEKERARQAAAQAKADKRRAKEQRKADKKQRRNHQPQPHVEVDGSSRDLDDGGEVRILSADEVAAITGVPAPDADAESATDAPDVPADSAAATAPVVSIADDGLPDPVYIEGDLGSGGSAEVGTSPSELGDGHTTVFIDDSGPGSGEVVPIDVATTAARMEPRMRERRLAVKRAAGRKRLKWVAIVTGVVAVAVAVLAVLGSGLFAIRDVDLEGAVYSRGKALDEAIGQLEGANVLRVDTNEIERMVERIPWVDDARVSTHFPRGATVEIRERQAVVVYAGGDSRYRVLDRDGRVLDVVDGRPVEYLELIVDDPADLDAGQIAPIGYRAAATLVSALTPHMHQRATSVSANADATELQLTLDESIQVRFGAARDLQVKLVRLQTVLTDPDPEVVPTELIDVSTNDPVVR